MWKNFEGYPLLLLAVFSAVVLTLVYAGQNRSIDTCVNGSLAAHNRAMTPASLVDTYLDARGMQFGLGSIAIGDWQSLGDGLVAGGQAWLRTTSHASPKYYSLVANRYFQTQFLVYVPTGVRPADHWQIEPGTNVAQLWQVLSERYPEGVLLEGYAHLRPLHTIAIAQPAIDGKTLAGNTPYYYTQPMESQQDAWIYAVGYLHAARLGSRQQTAETHLLFSTSPATDGLTYALTLRRPPLDPSKPPTLDNGVNVGQLMGTSEFIEGQFRLYPIHRIAECADAQLHH